MARPVTLFTGQWADLPLEELAGEGGRWGFDGLELACWGDHFEVDRGAGRAGLRRRRSRELLERHGLSAGRSAPTSSARPSATRSTSATRAILPPEVWGDGDPEGVRQRAAERMKDTARAAAAARRHQVVTASPARRSGTCSTRSRPTTSPTIERGYEDFAERWSPILDVFDAEGVRFALEVHPTEIAYDFVTTRKALDGDRAPRRASGSTSTRATSAPAPRPGRVRRSSSPTASTTSTSRTRSRRSTAGSSILGSHLELRRGRARLGLRLAGPRRRRLRGALPRAQPDRLRRARSRSSGRTPAWTASGARRTRWRSCAGPTSRRRRWPSTRRCQGADVSRRRTARGDLPAGGRARADRRRDARLRLHGQGALERLPQARLHDLAAAARAAARRDRRPQRGGGRRGRARATATSAATTDWRDVVADPRSSSFDNGGPEQPARRADDRRGRGGQARDLREAARPHGRRELRDLAARRGDRRQAHVRASTTASCPPCGSRAR